MPSSASASRLLSRLRQVDWVLLVLMVGITQNRFFALKIAAVVAALFLTPCLRAMRNGGLHFFYLAMAGWTAIQYVIIVQDYSASYTIVALYALVQWIMMAIIAAMLLAKTREAGIQTLNLYFWITAGLSLINLAGVLFHAGTLNPYEAAPEPVFGMSSGDHITGLYGFHLWTPALGNYSNVNASILALFVLFYFYHRQWWKCGLAFFLMLTASSNAITLATLAMLAILVILVRSRAHFSGGFAVLLLTAVFYVFVTPKNLRYLEGELAKRFGIEFRSAPGASSRPLTQRDWELSPTEISSRAGPLDFDVNKTTGKAHSFRQTGTYLLSSPLRFIGGAGAGRFSSLLALTAASKPEERGRIFRPLDFESAEYRKNHGKTVAAIKRLPPGYHTVSQMPYSWYNQICGEYGLLGLLLFLALYVGWCVRRAGRGAGVVLLPMLLLLAVADYTFEAFCIVPVFEWLIFLNKPLESQKETIRPAGGASEL